MCVRSTIKANLNRLARQSPFMSLSARLALRGSNLPTNIEECLHMLSAIIQKYNDQDEGDMPQEVDYLEAMDLLKRINDLRLNGSSGRGAAVGPNAVARIQTVTQVVIQWRERQTFRPPLERIQSGSAITALSLQVGFLECPICHHMVKDRYALTRHQKRITCKSVALAQSISPKTMDLIRRLNEKFKSEHVDACIRTPFLLQLSPIFLRAQPIIRRPKSDGSVPLYNKKPFPQRLLPKMLWNSIWDHRCSFHDEACLFPKDGRRMLIYSPDMFAGKVYPRPYMERKSLTQYPFTGLDLPHPRIFTAYALETLADLWGPWSLRLCIDVADDEREGDLSGWV